MKKLSNYLNEYSLVIKEFQIREVRCAVVRVVDVILMASIVLPLYDFFTHKYKTIGHHFGFHGLRFLKPSYVSIVALLPRPEGIGDSLYRFISKI